MNAPQFEKLLSKLREFRDVKPHWRVGQLLCNMALVARGAEPGAIWEVEDEQLISALDWQLAQFATTGDSRTRGESSLSETDYDLLHTKLAELHLLIPNQRVGQMICNLASHALGSDPGAVWILEDSELLDAIEKALVVYSDRREPVLA